jgi:hypothetical protein
VADVARRGSLAEAFDRIEADAGDGLLTFGSWHGDWTPWNMSRMSSCLIVWDWERSTRPVPLGFDVLHHRFQFAWRAGRHSVAQAVMTTRRGSGGMLSWLGVAAPDQEVLLRLYLLELILRLEEGSGDGISFRTLSADLEAALRERTSSR